VHIISRHGGRLAAVLVTGLIAACAAPVAAIDPPAFDGGKAYDHVRAMVGFGPRPAGSAALEQTRQYIRAQFAAMGVQIADQAFDAETPNGKVKMVNLRATIPGTRPERIIFAGQSLPRLPVRRRERRRIERGPAHRTGAGSQGEDEHLHARVPVPRR
jgi:hypothetical protein